VINLIMNTNGFLMKDRVFGLDLQLIADAVIVMIAVFVLFLLLSYLLFNPARDLLKKRQAKIQDDLDNAEKDKAEGAAYKEEYDARLKGVEKEAQEILSDSRKKALMHREEVVADAKAEAGRIVARAEQEAELEKNKVRDQVKQEMISVAAVMAGKIVASSIDSEKQKQLIDETLKEMGDETWQN